MMLRRVPLESLEPVASLALVRLGLVLCALVSATALDIQHAGRFALVLGVLGLPWSLAMVVGGRRWPHLALDPRTAGVDFAILALAELAAPDSYAAVRFIALFLIAAHAHVQGESRGFIVALLGVAVLIPITALTHAPVHGKLLAFFEVMFALCALASGIFVGRLRTAESTGRLRARELSRRAIEAENEVRRRVAESIHDGPVQELVSLDMMLEAARRALSRGDAERARETLGEARALTERNVTALREEIVGLGPYAFDQLSLDAALDQCLPVWSRRYDLELEISYNVGELPTDVRGALFGITQEAVANAGRHAGASRVSISVNAPGSEVELRVADDGHGFREPPLSTREPGHIGLASMRERAELLGGALTIRSGQSGATVIARVPLGVSDGDGRRATRREPAT